MEHTKSVDRWVIECVNAGQPRARIVFRFVDALHICGTSIFQASQYVTQSVGVLQHCGPCERAREYL